MWLGEQITKAPARTENKGIKERYAKAQVSLASPHTDSSKMFQKLYDLICMY